MTYRMLEIKDLQRNIVVSTRTIKFKIKYKICLVGKTALATNTY